MGKFAADCMLYAHVQLMLWTVLRLAHYHTGGSAIRLTCPNPSDAWVILIHLQTLLLML
jgi:hypothetical protein